MIEMKIIKNKDETKREKKDEDQERRREKK